MYCVAAVLRTTSYVTKKKTLWLHYGELLRQPKDSEPNNKVIGTYALVGKKKHAHDKKQLEKYLGCPPISFEEHDPCAISLSTLMT